MRQQELCLYLYACSKDKRTQNHMGQTEWHNCKPKAQQVAHQCSYQICWDPSQWWVLSPHHLRYPSIKRDRTCRNTQASGRRQILEKDNTLLRTVSCMAWFKHGSSHIGELLLELCCRPRKTAIPPATRYIFETGKEENAGNWGEHALVPTKPWPVKAMEVL